MYENTLRKHLEKLVRKLDKRVAWERDRARMHSERAAESGTAFSVSEIIAAEAKGQADGIAYTLNAIESMLYPKPMHLRHTGIQPNPHVKDQL